MGNVVYLEDFQLCVLYREHCSCGYDQIVAAPISDQYPKFGAQCASCREMTAVVTHTFDFELEQWIPIMELVS